MLVIILRVFSMERQTETEECILSLSLRLILQENRKHNFITLHIMYQMGIFYFIR